MRALATLGLLISVLAMGCGGVQRARVSAGAMPPGGTFTGVWYSPQYGEMHIVQTGATAVGRYQKEERKGRLQGAVEGDVMRFEWTENKEMIVGRPVKTKGRGYFRLVSDAAEDNWKLMGEWGHDNSETGGGPWNAVKSKKGKPVLDPSAPSDSYSGGDQGGDDDGFGGDDMDEDTGGDEDDELRGL